MSLTSDLIQYAKQHAIDLIGITSVEPFDIEDPHRGHINPSKFLTGAQSIIVLGYYYFDNQPKEPSTVTVPRGLLGPGSRTFPTMAMYCSKAIKSFLTDKGYNVIEENKIPAKMAAARAGIGVYGKNSIIHTEDFGSWVEFCCLITDAKLECTNRPYKISDCGDCTVCIESCPTNAIVEPYKVNPNRCITLWLWGEPVPIDQRAKVKNRIFRCGYCQEVCPKNKDLIPRRLFPVNIEHKSDTPELIPLLLGDEEYYKKVLPEFIIWGENHWHGFIHSFRRNVALALGNIGDKAAIPALIQTLQFPEPEVRAYSAWALGKLGSKEAIDALKHAKQIETNYEVKHEIRIILENIENDD